MLRRLRVSSVFGSCVVVVLVTLQFRTAAGQGCCPPFMITPTVVSYVGMNPNGNDTQSKDENGQQTAKVMASPVQWMISPSKAPCAAVGDHRYFYELPTNNGERYGYPAPLPTPYIPAPISPINAFPNRFMPIGTPFPNAYGATNGFYGGQTPIVPQVGDTDDGFQEENSDMFGVSPTAEAYQLGYMLGAQQAQQGGQQMPQYSPPRSTPLFPRVHEPAPKNPFKSPTTAPRRPIAGMYVTDPTPERVGQSQLRETAATADNEGFIIGGVTRSTVPTVTPNGTEFNSTDDLIAEVEQVGVVTLSPSKRKHAENQREGEPESADGFSTTWSTSSENTTTQAPRAQAFATRRLEEERSLHAVYTSASRETRAGTFLLIALVTSTLLRF